MDHIFHEKQEGSLCAQHCLNALLQGGYFTAVDLGILAQQIDDEEKARMAEGGTHSQAYREFLMQPSANVDDTGYFSVQVIARALTVWGLELVPYKSQHPAAQEARKNPTFHTAYICNYRDHWLTIRKIGKQWFNLNSLLSGPELLSDTHLSLFLAQLMQDGYSIFVVLGKLPDSQSDRALQTHTAVQNQKSYLQVDPETARKLAQQQSSEDEDDSTLQQTLRLSLETSQRMEHEQLQAALNRSLTDYEQRTKESVSQGSSSASSVPRCSPNSNLPTASGSADQMCASQEEQVCDTAALSPELSEEEMLELALKMSMES